MEQKNEVATYTDVPIKTIMESLLCQYDETVSINVDLIPHYEDPQMMIISVHTGEAGWEDNVTLPADKEIRAEIGSQAGEQFSLPFDIIATCDGPKGETISTTPVYTTDSVLGLEPVTLDEGLDQLRTKIGKSNQELRELVSDH